MRNIMRAAAATLFALGACKDVIAPAEPVSGATTLPTPAAGAWVDGRYPTEEEFIANGGGTGGIFSSEPIAYFQANNTFYASVTIRWSWVNSVHAVLSLRVTDASGGLLNTGADSINESWWIPFGLGERQLQRSIGTMGISCGLYGDASVSGHASLKLLVKNAPVAEVWSGTVQTASPQAYQGPCPQSTPSGGGSAGSNPPPPAGGGDNGSSGSSGMVCFDVYSPQWWWDYNTNTGGVNYYYDHTECYPIMQQRRAATTDDRAGGLPERSRGGPTVTRGRALYAVTMDSLPAGRTVVAVRRADRRQPDLVLVDPQRATARELAAALREARFTEISSTGKDQVLVAKSAPEVTAAEEAEATRLLAQLRRAPTVDLQGIGRRPAVRVAP